MKAKGFNYSVPPIDKKRRNFYFNNNLMFFDYRRPSCKPKGKRRNCRLILKTFFQRTIHAYPASLHHHLLQYLTSHTDRDGKRKKEATIRLLTSRSCLQAASLDLDPSNDEYSHKLSPHVGIIVVLLQRFQPEYMI